MKTTYIDKNGKLSLIEGFNFEGKVSKLKKILEDVLKEHGQDTKCRIEVTGRFPHISSSNIVLTNKK
jgi:shikimate kinase